MISESDLAFTTASSPVAIKSINNVGRNSLFTVNVLICTFVTLTPSAFEHTCSDLGLIVINHFFHIANPLQDATWRHMPASLLTELNLWFIWQTERGESLSNTQPCRHQAHILTTNIMANIRELCAQLGFNSITHLGIYPKNDGEFIYDASPLLEASQNFVKEHVAKHGYPDLSKAAVHRNLFVDFVPIAHDFLKHNRFAQQYWPVGSVERPFRGPKWKKDTDL